MPRYRKIEKEIEGRFPYATLHRVQTAGFGAGVVYQRELAGTGTAAAKAYVAACVKTNGQPHLLDIFEREQEIIS